MSARLQALFAPIDFTAFRRDYLGRHFLRIPGRPEKAREFFSWDRLNSFLEQHRLDPPRVRLASSGAISDPNSYLSQGRFFSRARVAEFEASLSAGASLVVDAIDEVHGPIRELVAEIESTLRLSASANVYASWRTTNGFNLHWDSHDAIILQIAGRKQWKVYGNTRTAPIQGEAEPTPKPTESPLWEGHLNEGDVLYLPRRCWHLAFPLDEPSLHVTFGLRQVTGADFLHWLADWLRTCEIMRVDMPVTDSDLARAAYAEAVRGVVNQAIEGDFVEDFASLVEQMAIPRPGFRLPHLGNVR